MEVDIPRELLYVLAVVIVIGGFLIVSPFDDVKSGADAVDDSQDSAADDFGDEFVSGVFKESVRPNSTDFERDSAAATPVYTESWDWSAYSFTTDLYFSGESPDTSEPYRVEWSVSGPDIRRNDFAEVLNADVMQGILGEYTDLDVTDVQCGESTCDGVAEVYDSTIRLSIQGETDSTFLLQGCRTVQDEPSRPCFSDK